MNDDALARLRTTAGRRPADARRPDAGLRLRLRAGRGRRGRPRGGGGVRRVQRARPDRVPVPADDGERAGRLRRRTCSTRRTAVGTVTSGGTESVLLAVQGARDARPEIDRAADGAARRPRTRRSTRPRTTSASRRCWCRSDPTSAPTPPRWPRRSTTTPCSWSPARRRTPTASSTRSPRSPPPPPARGVRCHVDACIGGWVLPYAARLGRPVAAVDVRGRGRHQHLGGPAQVRLHPQGRLDPAAPHAGAAAAAVLRERATGRATRCSTPTMQSTKSGGPLAGGVGGRQHDRRRGLR